MSQSWKIFWLVFALFAAYCVYRKKTAPPKDSCRVDLERYYSN